MTTFGRCAEARGFITGNMRIGLAGIRRTTVTHAHDADERGHRFRAGRLYVLPVFRCDITGPADSFFPVRGRTLPSSAHNLARFSISGIEFDSPECRGLEPPCQKISYTSINASPVPPSAPD